MAPLSVEGGVVEMVSKFTEFTYLGSCLCDDVCRIAMAPKESHGLRDAIF